jgi:hypothetical protein
MISDKLKEALQKTYAEVPAIMLREELIIFITSDWDRNLTNCMGFLYRGIEVKIIPETYTDYEKIIIMKKSDYEKHIKFIKKFKYENRLR